jgi:hypothetical protein
MSSSLEDYVFSVAGYPRSACAIWLLAVVEGGGTSVDAISGHIVLATTSWEHGAHGAPSPGPRVREAIADYIAGPPLENPSGIEQLAASPAAEKEAPYRDAEDFLEPLFVAAKADSYEHHRLEHATTPTSSNDMAKIRAYLESIGLEPWHVAAAEDGLGPLPPDYFKWNERAQRDWIEERASAS